MPPQPGMFLPDISQYRPPFSGGVQPLPYQSMDISGMMGGGPGGTAANMMLQPLLTQMMGQHGMVPGQFQPSMNMYDRLQAQQFFQQQQQSMQQAAQADLFQQRQMLSGIFQMGQRGPITAQQQQMINQGTQQLQPYAMMFAQMFPDTFDAAHGTRGMAQVMAQQFHLGGRNMIDPVTGQFGWRGATSGQMASQVYQNLYGEGADVSKMRGLGAGRAGQLFAEMANRGYIGSLTREETLRGMQAEGGFGSRDDMAKAMGGLDSAGMQQAMRTFDAKRAAGRIQETAGAISAMRDLFGEAGETNAPMPKLINAVNALTQGGMSTLKGAELEMSVRKTINLARSSGLGMDAMMQMMAGGAQLADQLGVDRSFVPGAAQRAAAFGQAYKATMGGAPGFGQMSAEEMTALSNRLEMGAAASPMANVLGAAAKMVTEGMVKPDSDMAKMLDAVKKNQSSFTTADGRTVSVASVAADPQKFMEMAGAAGVNPATAFQLLNSRTSNQEYAVQDKFGIKKFVRGQQGANEADAIIHNAAATALMPTMRQLYGDKEGGAKANEAAAAVRGALRNLTKDEQNDPAKVAAAVGQALRTQMGEDNYMKLGATDEERNAKIAQIAGATTSNIQGMVDDNPSLRNSFKSWKNLLNSGNQKTLDAAGTAEAQATFDSRMQTAFASIGQDSPVRRLAEAMATAGPDTSLGDVLSKFFGGVSQGTINRAIKPMAQQLADEQKKLTQMAAGEGEYGKMNESDLQKALDDQTRKVKEILGGKDPKKLVKLAAAQGIPGADPQELIRRVMAGEITDEAVVKEVTEAAGLGAMTQAGLGQGAAAGGAAGGGGGGGGRWWDPAGWFGGGGAAGGGAAGGGAAGGPMAITGTLTLKKDGTADLDGTGHRGGAQTPGGGA